MERVDGIEPTYTAWKAGALPLCYTRAGYRLARSVRWWREQDSNLCTLSDQIYSLAVLTTHPSLHGTSQLRAVDAVAPERHKGSRAARD